MWVIFGLISAVLNSLGNIAAKSNTKYIDPVVVSWLWIVFSMPVLVLPALVFGFSKVDDIFWIAILARTILDTVAIILYVKSLKISDLSLTQPMLSLTPILIIPISYFIFSDTPSIVSIAGIVLVSLGIYLNNFEKGGNLVSPFKNILKDKGVFLMFIVSIFYAFTNTLHSLGIKHSDPFTYAAIGSIALSISLSLVVLFFRKTETVSAFRDMPILNLIKAGALEGMSFSFQLIGQSFTQASYIVAVKRTSILFSALLAKRSFGENIRNRILPILIILIGVFLVVLGS